MKPADLNLTPSELAGILRRRASKGRSKLSGPKIAHKPDPVKADRGRERDPGFLAYLRRLPCAACLIEGGNCGPTEAAHLRFSDASRQRVNPGLSVKPSDRYATPLGAGHHRGDQHMRRERDFWQRLGVEPGALAADLYAAYLAGADGLPVMLQHTRRTAA